MPSLYSSRELLYLLLEMFRNIEVPYIQVNSAKLEHTVQFSQQTITSASSSFPARDKYHRGIS
jgi:hypothetical protein